MQNKANFRNDKMNINLDMTSNYMILSSSPGPKNKPNSKPIKPKNKPNSKPIKPKTNPIQTQLKPKQTQFKPNLSKREKMNAFARIKNLIMILIMLLANFTTLKGANIKGNAFKLRGFLKENFGGYDSLKMHSLCMTI
jgi:hypothetical protein